MPHVIHGYIMLRTDATACCLKSHVAFLIKCYSNHKVDESCLLTLIQILSSDLYIHISPVLCFTN